MTALSKQRTFTVSFTKLISTIKLYYVLILLTVLGLAALVTAVLVAWPAIAYLAS